MKNINDINKKELLKYFGSGSNIVRALEEEGIKVSRQAVANWGHNKPIPPLRAYQLREIIKKKKLKPEFKAKGL